MQPHRRKNPAYFLDTRRLASGIALAGLLLIVLYSLVGHEGRFAVLQMDQAQATLEKRIQALTQENRELERLAKRLRDQDFAAERFAREELGWTKPGEIVFLESCSP